MNEKNETLRRLHDENQRLRLIVPQVLEDLNDKLCEDNERLTAQRDALLEAYRKMKNVAAGYSNLCDDSASTSKLEREFEAADAIARAAIKAMEGK